MGDTYRAPCSARPPRLQHSVVGAGVIHRIYGSTQSEGFGKPSRWVHSLWISQRCPGGIPLRLFDCSGTLGCLRDPLTSDLWCPDAPLEDP